MKKVAAELKRTVLAIIYLWWAGVRDACSIHRCLVYFQGSNDILSKVFQCFVLNGIIFYGSIELLDRALRPAFRLLVGGSLEYAGMASEGQVSMWLQSLLVGLFHATWLLPAYLVSFFVNCTWCNDIARLAVSTPIRKRQQHHAEDKDGTLQQQQQQAQQQQAQQQQAQQQQQQPKRQPPQRTASGGVIHRISEELYRTVLFLVFYLQIMAAALLPRVGPAANFVLTSWLYAFYCFDYRWGLKAVPVEQRIQGFQRSWAFFLGFGSVATLPTVLLPFYKGAAAMAMLFPLFILVACRSQPDAALASASALRRPTTRGGDESGAGGGAGGEGKAGGGGGAGGELWMPSLPIFNTAALVTRWLMQNAGRIMQASSYLRG